MSEVEPRRVRADVVTVDVGQERVILDPVTGVYFGLNAVAARVWDLLSEGRRQSEIVECLAEEFDAPRTRIETDVEALLVTLLERKLLTD